MTKLEQKAKALREAKKIGREMAARRIKNRFSASSVASDIGVSPSMLCLLEKGRRLWTEELKQRYLKAVNL